MREIPLTQGQFAIVDDEDFDFLSRWKWAAWWNKNTRSYYATRKASRGELKPGTTVYMHRVVLGLEPGDGLYGDHRISGSTLDNTRANLRIASPSQNMMNSRWNSRNKSGFRGVSWNKTLGKWVGQLNTNKTHIWLGIFDTPELAHAAYQLAARKYHGEFSSPCTKEN